MMKWLKHIFIAAIIFGGLSTIIVAQEYEIISSENVKYLQSVQQIDYEDFNTDIEIGWFATNEFGTKYLVFDNNANLYQVFDNGEIGISWSYVTNTEEQLFTLIDAVYYQDVFFVLYVLDEDYWINGHQLEIDVTPLSLSHGIDTGFLLVEAVNEEGDTAIYEYEITPLTYQLTLTDIIPYPLNEQTESSVRVGRVELPNIIASSFNGDIFHWAGNVESDFVVENGPAVFGALNRNFPTHFAWSDPNSTYLNLLDLESGENQVVSELNGAYAQYYLLSYDASLVIAINVDFEPNVIAWDVETGARIDLGVYRGCERIPDKVELSADGTTLIIGCDTGLDIWRIQDEEETE